METFDTSWIQSYILKRPADQLDLLTAAPYWRYILMGSVPNPAFDQMFSLPAKKGFCLCGAPGTGRHSLARAFAGSVPVSVYEGQGYVTCQISGAHLLEEKAEDTRSRVRTLFETLSERPAILIVDALPTDALRSLVAAEFERCPARNPFTLFVIEEDEAAARKSWERILMICPISLPDEKERTAFFRADGNSLPAGRWTRDSAGWLGQHTEGMNYAQLRSIVLLGNYFMKVKVVSLFKGDLAMAMEDFAEVKVFLELQDIEGLLEAVRSREAKDLVPAPQGREEKKEEKEQGPIHLVIDNMPRVIQSQAPAPVQTAMPVNPLADLSGASPFEEKKPAVKALTPDAAEKDILRRMEERRKRKEERKRAEALNT